LIYQYVLSEMDLTMTNIRGLLASEIAERTGFMLGSLYHLMRRPDFPPPIATVGKVKIFDPADIDFWKRTRIDGRTREAKARKRRHK
jgi:predicted DNA-binding transcriptional regulator AlpA